MSAIKANLERLKKAQENAAKLPVLSDAMAAIRQRLTDAKFAADGWDAAIAHLEREALWLRQHKAQYTAMLEAEAHARLMAADAADAKRDPTAVDIPKFVAQLYAAPPPLAPAADAKAPDTVFTADDLKALKEVAAASPSTPRAGDAKAAAAAAPASTGPDFDVAAFAAKCARFHAVMADDTISAESWAAALAADDHRLVDVLGYAVASGIALPDDTLTDLLNNLALLAGLAPATLYRRLSATIPGFLSRFSAQFEVATDHLLEMRLRFFAQLCLHCPPATTTTADLPAAAEIVARLLDLLDHDLQVFVDAAAYALLLLHVIDGQRTVLHACADHKNRQPLMEVAYELVIRAAPPEGHLELSADERTKLEWCALVWCEHVQRLHPDYFYANDLRVLSDALLRQCVDGGLAPMLPEYLKCVAALLRMGAQYPKEPADDRADYKVEGLHRAMAALADTAAHARPQTDLIVDIRRNVRVVLDLVAPRLDAVRKLSSSVSAAAGGAGSAAAAAKK